MRIGRLPPAERKVAREALAAADPPPADARFLAHLGRAEEMVFEIPAHPAAAELADFVRDLYRMRPQQRAVRRAEWARNRCWETDWQAVAEYLERTDFALVRLDRPLFDRLTGRHPPGTEVRLPKSPRPRARVVEVLAEGIIPPDHDEDFDDEERPRPQGRWSRLHPGVYAAGIVLILACKGVADWIKTERASRASPAALVEPNESATRR